jgi:hypothetical protein
MVAAIDVRQKQQSYKVLVLWLKVCMKMSLSIAVQSVGGHADYVVKLGGPIFGIPLAPADRTLHRHLKCTVCLWKSCHREPPLIIVHMWQT